jgi:prepilin-type N-terminal cleavage/methylation domain-containing protein
MHRRRRAAGFTLIELMIALVMVAVITIQVLAMMSAQEHTYYAQKRALETQLDARLIADMVMRDVRGAGFMLPRTVGISTRDGGNNGADVLCVSDPAAISETFLDGATDRLAGAPLAAALGSQAQVQVDDADKDIDGDGTDDFVAGSGIIISDGTQTWCARVDTLGLDQINFIPTISGGWVPTAAARVVPAVIYELDAGELRRNALLVSDGVEDFQVEFGVDTSGDGIIGGGEFPIHDLNASGSDSIQLVRVSVLTRTATADEELTTPGRPGVANRNASGAADSFRRRLVTVGASPRNLL